MKKSATKFLAVVLCLAMVLGTSISAMAVTVGNTDIKVNYFDKSVNVKTSVETDAAEEVTYMVHNADNFFSVTKDSIKYIDQKNVDGATTFEYALDSYNSATDKIYVGGEKLDAPIQVDDATESDGGMTVKLNGIEVDATLDIEASCIKVYLPEAVNATVVTLNGEAVDFAKGNGFIHIVSAGSKDAVINIATAEITAVPVIIKGSSFAKLTPAEVGVLNINDSMFTNNNWNSAFQKAIYASQEYTSLYGDAEIDKVTGTYDWTAEVYYNATAGTAALVKSRTSTAVTTFTLRDASVLKADVDAILANIVVNGTDATVTAKNSLTDLGIAIAGVDADNSFIATIESKVALDEPMGRTFIPASVETEVYVPVAGNYRIFASYCSYGGGNRYMTVSVNGQTATIGDDDKEGTTAYLAMDNLGNVLDSQLIALEAGVNTVTINRVGTIRFDFLAFVPEASCQTLLDRGQSDNPCSYDVKLGYSWSQWNNYALKNHDMTLVASGIKIANPELTNKELLTFARVLGGSFANCGIKVTTADGVSEKFDAIGVDGNGYFAIGLENEDGSEGIGELFNGAEVSAYVDTYTSSVKTAKLAE